ncbi:hypothetical protein BKA82DRAFT_852491 [Pisolithus tinctorius]|uniref:Uncharacterized protein n=1 Tax=Pisolithus tinctorius Marx 270 TaxID=870435 RepID=A0A0C3NTC4_PISTI|nr:hypothetical protein BKA82DRAFT_852491 [Pisolithus tinctorius]KIN98483.1 hypothetical protein M404DRAFT_852491 [Pisolithus tinctorius Marx 270]
MFLGKPLGKLLWFHITFMFDRGSSQKLRCSKVSRAHRPTGDRLDYLRICEVLRLQLSLIDVLPVFGIPPFAWVKRHSPSGCDLRQ